MDKPQIFNHELFGELPVITVDGVEWFGATEAAKALRFTNPHKAIDNHVEQEDCTVRTVGVQTGFKADGTPAIQTVQKKFVNESGLYDLIFGAVKQGNNPEIREKAKLFKRWVTSDILPTVRKHGAYLTPAKLEEVLSDPDTIIQMAMQLKREREEKKRLLLENESQQRELDYKGDVIIGLVDEVDLATKRQILNRVVRHGGANYQERWRELYKQFEMKYHLRLADRLETYNRVNKPKLKNKVDFIDKVMGKIPELYEIACKLFESDVKELVDEMYQLKSNNAKGAISI